MSFQGCWCIGRHLLNTLCICMYVQTVMTRIQAYKHHFISLLSTFIIFHSDGVCLSWPARFLPSLPSLLSTVSINHQPLPGLRLILTIWRFYYWKIDQKSAKIIVLRQYFCLLFVATFIALQLIIHFGWYLSGNVSSFGKFIEHSFSSSVKSGPDFFCFLKTFSNNSEGLGCSPDLGKSRCPYFSCEIKTIHRRKKQC